jgi:hypothetical protein
MRLKWYELKLECENISHSEKVRFPITNEGQVKAAVFEKNYRFCKPWTVEPTWHSMTATANADPLRGWQQKNKQQRKTSNCKYNSNSRSLRDDNKRTNNCKYNSNSRFLRDDNKEQATQVQ